MHLIVKPCCFEIMNWQRVESASMCLFCWSLCRRIGEEGFCSVYHFEPSLVHRQKVVVHQHHWASWTYQPKICISQKQQPKILTKNINQKYWPKTTTKNIDQKYQPKILTKNNNQKYWPKTSTKNINLFLIEHKQFRKRSVQNVHYNWTQKELIFVQCVHLV